MSLDRLRERVHDFLEAEARERCAMLGVAFQSVGLGALHARASDLFSLDRLTEVQRAVAESAGLEERRARFLLEYMVRARSLCAAADELDERLTFEAAGSIPVGEGRVSIREAPARLAETEDPEARRATEERWLAALAVEEPPLHGLLDRQRDVYEELGYGSLVESCEVLSGIDLRGLAREGERFLEETEGEYRDLLSYYLPRLARVEPGEASAGDAYRLESAAPLADLFPAAEALDGTQRLLAKSGLDPRADGRIRIDRRPDRAGGKAAVCCPLDVPDEIVVVLSPRPGRRAHAATLDAFGRALHHGYTAPDLPLEFRWLGDRSVPLAAGRLFAGLLGSSAFLRDRYRASRGRAAESQRLSALLLLLGLRRDVGLLLVASEWGEAGGGVERLRELFVETLTRATGLRHDPRRALRSIELPFEFAWRVRAQQLGTVHARYLRERFDEDWYRNPGAGAALAELFAPGQRYLAPELAVQLTSSPLSFEPVLDQVRELLR